MNSKKLKTKDLIYAGAFAAIYIIILAIIVSVVGIVPIAYLMSPLFVGIICATIYMMYVTKVKKFGAILILACLFGLIMSSSGHFYSILGAIPIGIVAELIAKAGNYNSKKMFSLSYLVFNLTMIPPFLQLYLATDSFVEVSIEYYGQEYGDAIGNLVSTYGSMLLLMQVVVAIIGAAIGVTLAGKLSAKHFEKAGII
ncbi:MAG: hypothetical protein BEN19_02810 [Epulopiscium sp. Nuni2H_MBin003]|nr:MAG: hypothetical protein BEN19_02810 [Epulopiscium sp. Nuni2H_MBin003]